MKRAETAVALLITLAVLTLHGVRARHAGALWRDEAGAVQLAGLPSVGELFQRFPHEAFPMLFPLAVRGYTAAFGDSDRALRLFGLVVGIAILAALWRNARGAGTVPLVSLALLGFHPGFLVYGDSLRGYGLGILLILLTFGAFARLVERPDRRAVLAAGLLSLLSVHCLLHNAALLLGIGTAAATVGVLRRRWRVTAAALGVGTLAALSLLPYLGPLATAREWDVVVATPGIGAREILGTTLAALAAPSPAVAWIWGALLLAGVAGIIGTLLALARKAEPEGPAVDAQRFRLLTIPAAFAAQYTLFLVLGYLPRLWYVLPLMAVTASALDGHLAGAARFPALRVARLGVPILLAALALPSAAAEAKVRMTNVDQVARFVGSAARPRDLVLVNYWFYGISFARYYRGEARWMTLPRLGDHRFHRYDLLKARMTEDLPNRELLRAVRRTLRSGHRVWVVGTLDDPPAGRPPLALPPAPRAASGWQDGPYCLSWSQQMAAYLRESTREQNLLELPDDGPVSGYEYLTVRVFRGWRGKP